MSAPTDQQSVPRWFKLALIIVLLIGAFEAGRDYQAQQPLSYWQKHFIAIEYMCAPGHDWVGKRLYCGKNHTSKPS